MGVDIIAIRRNKDWILDPKGQERIFQGDILITRGAPTGIEDFKDLAEGEFAKLTLKNGRNSKKWFQDSLSSKIPRS